MFILPPTGLAFPGGVKERRQTAWWLLQGHPRVLRRPGSSVATDPLAWDYPELTGESASYRSILGRYISVYDEANRARKQTGTVMRKTCVGIDVGTTGTKFGGGPSDLGIRTTAENRLTAPLEDIYA